MIVKEAMFKLTKARLRSKAPWRTDYVVRLPDSTPAMGKGGWTSLAIFQNHLKERALLGHAGG